MKISAPSWLRDPERPREPITRTAAFLTRLIATARRVPQARACRRTEPADAIAAYLDALSRLHAPDQPSH